MCESQEFDLMVQREAPQITRLVGRLVAWGPDVEDLVQEVFVRAWKKRAKFRGESAESTWLHAIAVNVCRNYHRRMNLWQRIFPRVADNGKACADDDAELVDLRDHVWAAIAKLRPIDREIVVLRCMEEKTPAEAAAILGQSVNSVDVRLHRARQRLKAILEPKDA
ncbi:MAG: RNA polymerase sigma factor [Planctomycetota bacterium]